MFAALRQGSTIYILEKGETPTLKVGQIISVTAPTYGILPTVDLTAKVGEQ